MTSRDPDFDLEDDELDDEDEEARSAFYADLEDEHDERVRALEAEIDDLKGEIRGRDRRIAKLTERNKRMERGSNKTVAQLMAWSLMRHQVLALARRFEDHGGADGAAVARAIREALEQLDDDNARMMQALEGKRYAPNGVCAICGAPIGAEIARTDGGEPAHPLCLVREILSGMKLMLDGFARGAADAAHDDEAAVQYLFVLQRSIPAVLRLLADASDHCTPG